MIAKSQIVKWEYDSGARSQHLTNKLLSSTTPGKEAEKQRKEQGTERFIVITGTNVKAKKQKKEQVQLGDKAVQHNAQRQRMINKRSSSMTPQVATGTTDWEVLPGETHAPRLP